MIIEVNEQMLDEVVEFCWDIAKDKHRYGFPRFDSYQSMSERFLKAALRPEDKILAYYKDEGLVGVLNLNVEGKENYLQAIGGIFTTADFNSVANLFIDYLRTNYAGFEFYIGFPVEHVAGNNYFKAIKAKPLDASLTMKLEPQDFIYHTFSDTIIQVDHSNFKEYADFHDKYHQTIYWNSSRILKKFELWHIFYVQQNNTIVGSISIKQNGLKQLEVFGLTIEECYRTEDFELKLLNHAINKIITPEIEDVLFFIDEDNQVELNACFKTGFKQIDTYRSYKVAL